MFTSVSPSITGYDRSCYKVKSNSPQRTDCSSIDNQVSNTKQQNNPRKTNDLLID